MSIASKGSCDPSVLRMKIMPNGTPPFATTLSLRVPLLSQNLDYG